MRRLLVMAAVLASCAAAKGAPDPVDDEPVTLGPEHERFELVCTAYLNDEGLRLFYEVRWEPGFGRIDCYTTRGAGKLNESELKADGVRSDQEDFSCVSGDWTFVLEESRAVTAHNGAREVTLDC